MIRICMLGNTGSGKSTVARLLAEELGVPLVSSGDVARSMAERDPVARRALEQGLMAPEAAMRHEMRRLIEEADVAAGGWVMDGFPRNVAQLICLMQWTAPPNEPSFVELSTDELTCIERMCARGREHDSPDAIDRRLRYFREETLPMIRLLQPLRVNPHRDPEAIAVHIVKELS